MNIKNQRIMMAAVLSCLVLSAIFYYYNNIKIPKMEAHIEALIRQELDENVMPRKLVAVVTDPNGITQYTQLTDDVINQKITLMEIPVKYSVEGSIDDTSNINGMITKHSLRYGQQLVIDNFYTEDNWYGEYERLKEFEVVSLVADEVKAGNIIDVIVNYGNGDYDVVIPKIKVHKVIANAKEDNPRNMEYKVIIAVDEIGYRDLHLALELGQLETRLYLDRNQPPSIITFDYHHKVKELRLIKVSDKTIQGNVVDEQSVNYPTGDDE